MEGVTVSSWAGIREGCPISCDVMGSGVANVTCGEGFEFQIDSEALRELVRLGSEALDEMDARYAREEAEDTVTS